MSKKEFDFELFLKKKDKTVPEPLVKLVRSCIKSNPCKRPTFSAIAKFLVDFHNQEYRTVAPIEDEEASISMDVATGRTNLKRSKTERKRKHHSLELCLPATVLKPEPAPGKIFAKPFNFTQDLKKLLLGQHR